MFEIKVRHPWNVSPSRAVAIQRDLAGRVLRRGALPALRHVAGIDVGFEAGGTVAHAAVAVLSYPALELVEHACARRRARFPYVPGLLSFRELPVILAALRRLRTWPQVLLCDGQGYAHPRRFGLACHLGVVLDWPAIGVAKSLLTGTHAPVPRGRGAWRALVDRNQRVGAAVRTRTDVRPVYVSVGHRISLRSAIALVLTCAPRYRLPETTRHAHALASSRTALARPGP
jgi:deoxyribonuclease V